MPSEMRSETRAAYSEGLALLKADKAEEAAAKLEEVTKAVPRFAQAHYDYARALAKIGRTSDAVKELSDVESSNPTDAEMFYRVGHEFQMLGERDAAIRNYERYVWLQPNGSRSTYSKNAIESMRNENGRHKTQIDSRGSNSYLDETLDGEKPKRWFQSQMPIPVYIHSGTGLKGYDESYDRILKESFAHWEEAAPNLIKFRFVDVPDHALIECIWTADRSEFASPIRLGEASTRSRKEKLTHSKIRLITMDSDDGPLKHLKGTCIHEIGHALGLHGHSSDPGDIMFMWARSVDRTTLSERDKATIRALYSIPDTNSSAIGTAVERESIILEVPTKRTFSTSSAKFEEKNVSDSSTSPNFIRPLRARIHAGAKVTPNQSAIRFLEKLLKDNKRLFLP